jgi:tetratricopeptide (TPR) repeat protein
MSDQEAWSELCDLYLAESDYSRAVFCAEELLLHTPHNFFVHQRLADIRYTMGGLDNLKIAVSYYAQAHKLNNSSMRALSGLFLVRNFKLWFSSLQDKAIKDSLFTGCFQFVIQP